MFLRGNEGQLYCPFKLDHISEYSFPEDIDIVRLGDRLSVQILIFETTG